MLADHTHICEGHPELGAHCSHFTWPHTAAALQQACRLGVHHPVCSGGFMLGMKYRSLCSIHTWCHATAWYYAFSLCSILGAMPCQACAFTSSPQAASPTGLQLIGNGDVLSYTDWNEHMSIGSESGRSALTSCMIGRGALIKPWIFQVSDLLGEGCGMRVLVN